MKPTGFLAGVSGVAILLLQAMASAQEPSLHWIGTSLHGRAGSTVSLGVSPDGGTVVGRFKLRQSPWSEEGITWTREDGLLGLGSLPGDGVITEANAVSKGGDVVVGRAAGDWDWYHAAYATGGEVFDLEEPGEVHTRSQALGVSPDGAVVVGFTDVGRARAFHWTGPTGMLEIAPPDSRARGVSANGGVVGLAESEAFRWTDQTGTVGLGYFPEEDFSAAFHVSADGSVVVGRASRHLAGSTSTFTEAFRWTEDSGMVGLGSLAEDPVSVLLSRATAVSGNGRFVVGRASTPNGDEAPFIWDATHGMRAVEEVLVDDCGLDLTGVELRRVTDISHDGRTLVGWGYGPSGQKAGWVAVILEPATLSLLGLGGLLVVRYRRRRRLPAILVFALATLLGVNAPVSLAKDTYWQHDPASQEPCGVKPCGVRPSLVISGFGERGGCFPDRLGSGTLWGQIFISH